MVHNKKKQGKMFANINSLITYLDERKKRYENYGPGAIDFIEHLYWISKLNLTNKYERGRNLFQVHVSVVVIIWSISLPL